MIQNTGITKNQFLFSAACFFMASPLFLAILFKNAGHESWIISIVGAVLGFVVSYMIMTLYKLNKGKELAGICKAAFGKTAGVFFCDPVSAVFLFSSLRKYLTGQ